MPEGEKKEGIDNPPATPETDKNAEKTEVAEVQENTDAQLM
jgi:hypothetical protein